ncbi:MAG TPA: hypothetical protein VEX60_10735, partial [Pyrinomonadaceae bacterium]|nr:hypothetical protein [Pyrinomonadaceae bacterium]
MRLNKWIRVSLTICMIFVLTLALPASASQDKSKKDETKKDETKPTGTPVLWKEPGDIATR